MSNKFGSRLGFLLFILEFSPKPVSLHDPDYFKNSSIVLFLKSGLDDEFISIPLFVHNELIASKL